MVTLRRQRGGDLARAFRPVQEYAVPPLPGLSLVELVEEACLWQDEAETVIARCVAPGGKDTKLARRGHLVLTVYGRLLEGVRERPASADQREAAQLVAFHQRLVHEALQLGFRPDSDARQRVAAHFRGGLGEPGRRLLRLRDDIRACPEPCAEAGPASSGDPDVRPDTDDDYTLDLG